MNITFLSKDSGYSFLQLKKRLLLIYHLFEKKLEEKFIFSHLLENLRNMNITFLSKDSGYSFLQLKKRLQIPYLFTGIVTVFSFFNCQR